MDGPTRLFLIFVAFSLSCFVAGYVARRRGWVAEDRSRPMHLHTILWFWSPVALIAFWALPMHGPGLRDLITLMLAQPLLMVGPALATALLARWAGCRRRERGLLFLGAGLSNHGFTLGAYLCYALLEPSDQALRYGIAYVTSMQIFMVLLFYPVAHHYGPDRGSLSRLMANSFLTLRAMPLYTALAGVVLNLAGAPYPRAVEQWHLVDLLFFCGAAGSYGGIGLRFRMTDSLRAMKMHVLLGVSQFLIHPAMALGLLGLLAVVHLAPGPLVGQVILVQALTPTALNTVMVSNLFRLDARLASVLWLWNTLFFCVVPLPLLLWLY